MRDSEWRWDHLNRDATVLAQPFQGRSTLGVFVNAQSYGEILAGLAAGRSGRERAFTSAFVCIASDHILLFRRMSFLVDQDGQDLLKSYAWNVIEVRRGPIPDFDDDVLRDQLLVTQLPSVGNGSCITLRALWATQLRSPAEVKGKTPEIWITVSSAELRLPVRFFCNSSRVTSSTCDRAHVTGHVISLVWCMAKTVTNLRGLYVELERALDLHR